MPRPPHRLLVRTASAVVAVVAIALAAAPGASAGLTGDPLLGEQWAISRATVLNLDRAWALSTGEGAIVAVIDSGARLDHRDLAPNLWVNRAETAGNRVDDDGNGYVDDVNGVDLTTPGDDNVPEDEDGHGTHVAGIVAAAANRFGVVGIAHRARLMTVKVLDRSGRGTTNAVAEGIRYAAANGADVVTMSLNGPTPTDNMESALRDAAAANVLVVSSAGNQGIDVDRTPSYPCSYALSNLICVAATSQATAGNGLAGISNYGVNTVGLAAPGESILSAARNGDFELRTGTSMATPMVAGVGALMVAAQPTALAPDLRARILENARRVAVRTSAGALDAFAAVRSVSSAQPTALGQPPRLRVISAIATRVRRSYRVTVQARLDGTTETVRRVRLLAGSRRLATVTRRVLPINARATLRRRPASLVLVAQDRSGRTVSRVTARVRLRPPGKPNVGGTKNVARSDLRAEGRR